MFDLIGNSINDPKKKREYIALNKLADTTHVKIFTYTVVAVFFIFFLLLFAPWTQNVSSTGTVTTLRPEQRPQTINSAIAGSIAKWFVREGDLVQKGDTILFLAETKTEYFDPALIQRTQLQIKAKQATIVSYEEKMESLGQQIQALRTTMNLKMEQARNKVKQVKLKVTSDSIDLAAVKISYAVSERQVIAQKDLYEQGISSLTELEAKRVKFQDGSAKLIGSQNKLLTSENELINAQIQLNSVENEYIEKMSKAESDRFSAMSQVYDSENELVKLQNQVINYTIRNEFYYVTAPQTGFITKTIRAGVGEIIKEGDAVATIVPSVYDIAASLYIQPVDLPLMELGEHVRLQFDGWPALVFSGWEDMSFGTFGGTIVAIDQVISDNGKFRILVAPDPEEPDWPSAIRPGGAAYGWSMLNDVPLGYEFWRQLNGFPPDLYSGEIEGKKKKDKSGLGDAASKK